MRKELIVIVDRNDEIIGYKDRGTFDYSKDIYRISALWITDPEGNILLAQRSFDKPHNPGLFGAAVSGTVEEGQDYYTNIIKEADEELGLTGLTIEPLDTFYTEQDERKRFLAWYVTTIDVNTEFQLQEKEVASVRWFAKDELEQLLSTKPEMFLSSLVSQYDKIMDLIEKKGS